MVLLTEQTDPTQNGVYEVVLGEADPTMVRVGDPARRGLVVRLGPGWAVSDVPDEHGFFAPVPVIDQRMTEAMSDTLRAAIIGSAEGHAAIHPNGYYRVGKVQQGLAPRQATGPGRRARRARKVPT